MFKPNAADTIGAAGVEQTQLAERSDYPKWTLNRRLRQGGRLRQSSAAKIATAFAELARTTKEQAFAQLFEEVAEEV